MAAALPPWPHPAAATETCARFCGKHRMTAKEKPTKQPCSVRLRSRLILSRGFRGADGRYLGVTTDPVGRALDHRVEVADPAALRSVEACSGLIHALLAEAPVTAGYDLGSDNWMDSSTHRTPLDIAMGIVTYVREQIDGIVDMGCVAPSLDIDIHLCKLRVTLVYSAPKAMLLACKEAAAAKTHAARAPAAGRKQHRESNEPCVICMADEDTWDEVETVTLPCSHAFHSGCILKWFYQASTCPICRRDLIECFSFGRSPASPQQFTDDMVEEELMIGHGG